VNQPLKPEERARVLIDEQLTRAGWHVCDRSGIDLVNHKGNAVREVIMAKDHGRADYLLYVDKKVAGAIEAKPVGTPLAGVQWQSAMYAAGLPAAYRLQAVLKDDRLPFVHERLRPDAPCAQNLQLPEAGDPGANHPRG